MADEEGEGVIGDVLGSWFSEGKTLTKAVLLFKKNVPELSGQHMLSMKREMHA